MADSKAADAQMGMEKLMNCLMASLAGLNVVAGVGQTDFINTVRADQMFIDNEMISLVKRMCRGIKVDEDTMALDAIGQVGPGGNYLANEHTVANFRQELWFPRLFDRKIWAVWEEEGAQDIADRARLKVESAKQNVPPLEEAVSKEIMDIVRQADQRYL
jgi:trimethylamine--corrinoid protein Co-methyltransferase